ncbi:MAG: PHP domain-containing protein [Promethearchaeota archaeon]
MARIIDYHIHTSFSDGFLRPREMILAAAEKGVREVCITDHYSNWKPALSSADFEEYYVTIDNLRKNESLGVKVFIGIEVDFSSIEALDSLQEIQWDLILFEYVFAQSGWEKKFQQLLNFKKKNPHSKVGLAHTRFTRVSEAKINYVLEKIREYEIIVEMNTGYGNYMDHWFNYLDDGFWYSIGSDAHHKESLGTTLLAINYLEERNIPLSQVIIL